ncbi:MAG: hypothetical protein M1821_006027 [Bathelium mastoideum]|nr:MAG: hypothetical protein M1821_006027 [Bathelium mastoideum]
MADMLDKTYELGDVVPFHLIPWIVVLSFVASLIGTLTTVELLHRRITTGKRWLSMLQLFACSISMGLVGIWCMHFVGNRAIILAQGQNQMQLVYSPGSTALSVFLPIVFLFIGFFIADRESQKQRGRVRLSVFICIAGIAAGLSIVGMHYVGNFGILNYKLSYTPRYIGGAIIVAVVDATGALAFFFSMKELWINKWWSRLLTAIFLAIAVSGMHWVASVGVVYRLKVAQARNAGGARNVNLIIAVAISFGDEFNVAHPAFHWVYRVTYNWSGVVDLIPRMRRNLRYHSDGLKDARPSSSHASTWEHEGQLDYSLLFRESFCVAAADLAQEIQVPVWDLGVLYDDIMTTGTISPDGRPRLTLKNNSRPDLELGVPMTFGKGQLLFVVRQVSKVEVPRLISAGYRFAAMSQVGEIIARSMQVPTYELASHVDRLRGHCSSTTIDNGSKYLVCYALRSKATQKGFDILVPRAIPCQLPKVELPLHQLQPWQQEIFARLEGKSVRECLQWLNGKASQGAAAVEEEEDFKDVLYDRIAALTQAVGEPWFYQAVFCSRPFTARFTGLSNDSSGQVTIYAFCIIPDVHNSSLKPLSDMVYTPLSFFKTRQRIFKDSPDHSALARQIHHEFAPMFHQSEQEDVTRSEATRAQTKRFRKSFRFGKPASTNNVKPDNSSERELVQAPSATMIQDEVSSSPSNAKNFPFGGILVSSDMTVDTDKDDSTMEMRKLGITALISAEKTEKEPPTYVDHLYNVTSSRFSHNISSRVATKAP